MLKLKKDRGGDLGAPTARAVGHGGHDLTLVVVHGSSCFQAGTRRTPRGGGTRWSCWRCTPWRTRRRDLERRHDAPGDGVVPAASSVPAECRPARRPRCEPGTHIPPPAELGAAPLQPFPARTRATPRGRPERAAEQNHALLCRSS